MHIPDNYLSPETCAIMAAAVVPVWVHSVRKVTKDVPRERIPLLGIGAAFSFLLMMFNVPLPGGTTGHAVGGTLLAVLMGPEAACISVTIALLIQALLFGDGGILAFGANCFNMAFVIPFLGYALWRLLAGKSAAGIPAVASGVAGTGAKPSAREWIGLAIASWLAIVVASFCAAVEFGLQPLLFRTASGLPRYCPYPLAVSIPAMVIPHMAVAGVVEAAFTVAIVAFVRRVSPGMIQPAAPARTKPLFALIAGLIVLTPLGLLASGTAWGEWGSDEIAEVASGGKTLGFVPEGMKNGFSFEALMPDYGVKGLPDAVGYIVSAVAGVAVLVILFKLLSLLKKDAGAKA